ncbi:hypothetical protein [Streptomyces wuyuanensis]|uniref:hypothetical protein n=1 Tax=Streptomyces wuyuanensis TaxID=1196353 RepID=UPI003D705F9A
MPSTSSRWHRVLAVVAALTAVLTGALLCQGTGATAVTGASQAGSGAAEEGRRQPAAVAPAVAVAPASAAALTPSAAPPSAVAPPAAVPAGEERLPGCGEGAGDGGLSPATPPRGSAAHELLPALPATAQGATGCSAAGDAVLDLAPERAPPAPAAPGPIDLSVLRV